MPLYFVTGNTNKFREVQGFIPEIEQLKLDLDEIQSLDPHVVIEHKLNQAAQYHNGEFIVEDTSLSLDCLGGLPGTCVKWFQEALGLDGIAELAAKYPDQSATARATIGYRDAKGRNHVVTGEIRGRIVAPRGDGFGWDAIFVPEGYDQTFGELGPELKSTISHRRQAIDQLKELLAS
ncbi:MAG: hypothetical protein JWN01_241 [Patescibacteria group bacterium]|nr:hypothetical protein [Patescibacteria group bacterium]